MVAWLEGKGMHFENVIEFLREGQAPKCFTRSHWARRLHRQKIVDTLSEECRARGIAIVCDTQALALRKDARGGWPAWWLARLSET